MTRSFIQAKRLFTQTPGAPTIDNGAMIINGDTIEAVGTQLELEALGPFDAKIGSDRFAVIPGLNNTHYHCGGGNILNLGIADQHLETWLLAIHGAFGGQAEGEIGEDIVYTTTQYFGCQQIHAGITACLDNFLTNHRMADYGIGAAVKGYAELGLRVSIAPIAQNQNMYVFEDDESFLQTLPADLAARARQSTVGLAKVEEDEYIARMKTAFASYEGAGDGRIKIFLSPYAGHWTTESLVRKIKDTARDLNTGIQLHMLETRYELQYAQKTWGKSAVAQLHDSGFLDDTVSCAHMVWLTDTDLRMLADNGATCVHNPVSNLRLGSGIARVEDMLTAGVKVALGTDGMGFTGSNDMLNELRLGYHLARRPGFGTPFMDLSTWLELATRGGAQAIGLSDDWGTLEAGQKADLILIDLERIGAAGMDAYPSVEFILQYANNEDVHTVIINGEIVQQDGRIVTVDEAALAAKLKDGFAMFREEIDSRLPIARELEPYVEAFFRQWDEESLPGAYRYNTH